MKPRAPGIALLACLAALSLPASASQPRDPLTDAETDQLREVAQEPKLKLKLYLQFAGERLTSAEALRYDPKAGPDRSRQIHDLLEDFGSLVDELGDNVDAYAARHEDLRKSLPDIIHAASDWAVRLNAFKREAAATPAATQEAKAFHFVLEDAIDSVNSTLQDAQEVLEEQKELFKKKK